MDPYARADFFLSFSEKGVEVEEGFATFTALPWKLLLKVGRMRVSFGKINTLHLHVLPWADEPLPVVNLLGGEEGWIGTGVSLGRIIPLPGDMFSELTLQVFDGHAEGLFDAQKRGDLAYNAHYRVFADLTEELNLDWGLSYGQGPGTATTSTKTYWTQLAGSDLVLRWKPLRQGNYRSASLRGGGDVGASGTSRRPRAEPDRVRVVRLRRVPARQTLVRRRARRGLGARRRRDADGHGPGGHADLLAQRVLAGPHGAAPAQVRSGVTATEALFQLQFAIGAHGAHPF